MESEAPALYRMRCVKSQTYDVLLSQDLLDVRNRTLANALGSRPALVVTDRMVDSLFGVQLRTYLASLHRHAGVYVADLGERTKTISTVLDVCVAAQRHGLGRRDPLVAFGGGVCTDIVSVAASLIRRGIPYICVPTTLVAQVDAGIGLKGGVNFNGAKNFLGCFLPPSRVLIDPTFLRTVPVAELRAGLAEIVKVALVLDGGLFERVASDGVALTNSGFRSPARGGVAVIARAAELMLDQLAENCYEDLSLERLVDFGHTFSGTLEELSCYELRHGEAVAIDIVFTCALGVELDLLDVADFETVVETFIRLEIPVHSPLLTVDTAAAAIRSTVRHRNGALNLVVPTGIGTATLVHSAAEIPATALTAAATRVERAADTAHHARGLAAPV